MGVGDGLEPRVDAAVRHDPASVRIGFGNKALIPLLSSLVGGLPCSG
jgi:hypothetical protein